jgi:pimeloyl-ACP methyl ester carboxylesterase
MRFAVEGAALNVADTGGVVPFVFQHGLGGDAGQTAEVFPAAAGRRLVTLECRGHGRSEAGPATAFSLAQFRDDLGAFIARTLPAPVAIGGISMGAAITLMLAVQRPELVKALVIARPAWLLDAAPANMEPNASVGELLSTLDPAAARAAFEQSTMAQALERTAPDNLASLRGFFASENPQVLAALLTCISRDGTCLTAADLGRLTIPVLVIGTDEDHIHPFAHAEALTALIPDAKLVKITAKSASREAYVREFRAALDGFLDRNGM